MLRPPGQILCCVECPSPQTCSATQSNTMLSDPGIWEPSSGDGAHTGNETPKFDHATALPESRAPPMITRQQCTELNSIITEAETRDQVCCWCWLVVVCCWWLLVLASGAWIIQDCSGPRVSCLDRSYRTLRITWLILLPRMTLLPSSKGVAAYIIEHPETTDQEFVGRPALSLPLSISLPRVEKKKRVVPQVTTFGVYCLSDWTSRCGGF